MLLVSSTVYVVHWIYSAGCAYNVHRQDVVIMQLNSRSHFTLRTVPAFPELFPVVVERMVISFPELFRSGKEKLLILELFQNYSALV